MVNCSSGAIAFLPIAVKNVFDKKLFSQTVIAITV